MEAERQVDWGMSITKGGKRFLREVREEWGWWFDHSVSWDWESVAWNVNKVRQGPGWRVLNSYLNRQLIASKGEQWASDEEKVMFWGKIMLTWHPWATSSLVHKRMPTFHVTGSQSQLTPQPSHQPHSSFTSLIGRTFVCNTHTHTHTHTHMHARGKYWS
jgi:hypothetical protein